MENRNFRACFCTSVFLLFVGFLIISAGLSILISYTISIPASNKTEIVSSNSSMQWLNSLKGNSPEQSLFVFFTGFFVFGLAVCIFGFCILCCSVNCGYSIYPEIDKTELVNGNRRQVR